MVDADMAKKMVKGFRELIILHFLFDEPMHGYEIMKKFEEIFSVDYPSSVIYPLLRGLEEKGYIVSEWGSEGEREKRVYSITGDGKKVLDNARNIMGGPAKEVLGSIIGE